MVDLVSTPLHWREHADIKGQLTRGKVCITTRIHHGIIRPQPQALIHFDYIEEQRCFSRRFWDIEIGKRLYQDAILCPEHPPISPLTWDQLSIRTVDGATVPGLRPKRQVKEAGTQHGVIRIVWCEGFYPRMSLTLLPEIVDAGVGVGIGFGDAHESRRIATHIDAAGDAFDDIGYVIWFEIAEEGVISGSFQ